MGKQSTNKAVVAAQSPSFLSLPHTDRRSQVGLFPTDAPFLFLTRHPNMAIDKGKMPLDPADEEALDLLQNLLDTEDWVTNDFYTDDKDELAAPLPRNHTPDRWCFFSSNGTAFEGTWIYRPAGTTDGCEDEEEEGEEGEELSIGVNASRKQRKNYLAALEAMGEVLLEETRRYTNLPPPSRIRESRESWMKREGGWFLDLRPLDCDDGRVGLDITVCTHFRVGTKRTQVERTLVRGEMTRKGIDVKLYRKSVPSSPRRGGMEEEEEEHREAVFMRDLGVLHL
ncbi:hypothetical protein NMY22_g11022 [Coprinellus aureogranulatus]|nr:hypothetical protein NMY22_g11022 [Coprinellus aureogranulatus]